MGEAGRTTNGSDAPTSLFVDVVAEPSGVRVLVEGELDRWTKLVLHEAVWGAAGHTGDFVIDLRGVTGADVAGIQGLVELWRIGIVDRFEHVPAVVRAVVGRDPGAPFAD